MVENGMSEKADIHFLPLSGEHLPLFRTWLAHPHVKEHWQEPEDAEVFRRKFLEDLPRRGVRSFLMEIDGEKAGYIQYYAARKVGGGWWENEPEGTFGIDLLIGEPGLLGKGLGAVVIRAFARFMQEREPSLETIIIDPDPANLRAVRSFEKAGFRPEGEITTPGGKALLMRMKKEKLA